MKQFVTIEDLGNVRSIFNEFWNDYTNLGRIYTTYDIFVSTIINRAVNIDSAFHCLFIDKNLIAATPLIRLQLDNILYCYAGYLADDFNEFLLSYLKGENWNSIKDSDGNFLKENYLLDLLSKKYQTDLLKGIYKIASDFIHLSQLHMFLTLSEDHSIQAIHHFYTEEAAEKILEIMLLLSNLLIEIISDYWKPNRIKENEILNQLQQQYPDKTIAEIVKENAYINNNLQAQMFSLLQNKKLHGF